MSRSFRASALIAALAVALVPLGGAAAADPYEINVVTSLTGGAAFLGKEEVDALNVIEGTTNKAGGVRGRPIKFVIHDDGSSPQNAVALSSEIIAKNAPVILGTSLVASCSAMAPLMANGPVQYCFSPGIRPPEGSYVFSASISTADFILATIRFFREKGWRKVALLTSSDATGQDGERGITAAVNAEENHGTVSLVDIEHFNTTDVSVAAQMAHIKASGAQVAILWTVGTQFGNVLRGAVQAGLDIPLSSSAGNLNYAQLASYSAFMPKNLYFMAPPWAGADQLPNGPVKKAVHAYLDAFKAAGIRPDEGQSLAWDSAALVIEALRKFGLNATAAQIKGYIAGQRGWVGINGVYDFSAVPQRGIGIGSLVMVRYDPDKQNLIGVSKPGGLPL
jgi:branched-chain amino acid transport system substrate-binding protein